MRRRRTGKVPKPEKRIDQTSYLTGKRRGAVLKEEVWFQGERVVKYSLAYVNPLRCRVDNGRVLGYDNSHNRHHRHYMGETQAIDFLSYESLVNRFEEEVRELWRREDEAEN